MNNSKLFSDEAANIYERAISTLLKKNMLLYFSFADYEEVRSLPMIARLTPCDYLKLLEFKNHFRCAVCSTESYETWKSAQYIQPPPRHRGHRPNLGECRFIKKQQQKKKCFNRINYWKSFRFIWEMHVLLRFTSSTWSSPGEQRESSLDVPSLRRPGRTSGRDITFMSRLLSWSITAARWFLDPSVKRFYIRARRLHECD